MNEFILVVIAMFCTAYLLCSMRGGVPESISATYYSLGRYGWLFQAFMVVLAAMLYAVWFPLCEPLLQCLPFLSCGSLLFVAAAPSFKMELEGLVHYSSAIGCCVCAVLWQMLEGLWDVTLWWAAMAFMLSLGWKDKWCWWLECAVIGSLLCNLWRIV